MDTKQPVGPAAIAGAVGPFIVAGLAPLTLAIVLAVYLVTSMVARVHAIHAAVAMAALVTTTWWLVPLVRAHDRIGRAGFLRASETNA